MVLICLTLNSQEWGTFFDILKGPTFPNLFKQFWVMAKESRQGITANVVGMDVSIIIESITHLLNHDGTSLKCYSLNSKTTSLKTQKSVISKIFKSKKSSSMVKDLLPSLNTWARIFEECIYEKEILYNITCDKKINLPFILFRYLRNYLKSSRLNTK